MARSYKSIDARVLVKPLKKAAVKPVQLEENVKVDQPQDDRSFQAGDVVCLRTNTRGIVLAVTGDGVQVDFGLGAGWFNQQSLKLIKAVSASK